MQETSNEVVLVSQLFALPLVSQWLEIVAGRDTDSKVLAALARSASLHVPSDQPHIRDREASDMFVTLLRKDIHTSCHVFSCRQPMEERVVQGDQVIS